MPTPRAFANKIEELNVEDIEYTDDFFKKAFGSEDVAAALKRTTREVSRKNITRQFSDDDIDEEWLVHEPRVEGQLAVDVFQTEEAIIILSPVAGVRVDDLDISLQGDMITIRGVRRPYAEVEDEDYFIRECYWGGFSRSIILPLDVQHDAISATLEHGILTIILPKSHAQRQSRIAVVDISS